MEQLSFLETLDRLESALTPERPTNGQSTLSDETAPPGPAI